jgi:hypothetical protein
MRGRSGQLTGRDQITGSKDTISEKQAEKKHVKVECEVGVIEDLWDWGSVSEINVSRLSGAGRNACFSSRKASATSCTNSRSYRGAPPSGSF